MGEVVEIGRNRELRAQLFTSDAFMVHWPMIERELWRIRPVWEDRWTIESIREYTVMGIWQAWGFGYERDLRLVVWTQVVDFPAGRILQVPLAFGNSLRELMPIVEAALEKFVIEEGCKSCEVVGRMGWAKVLSKRFECRGVLMVAEAPKIGVVH